MRGAVYARVLLAVLLLACPFAGKPSSAQKISEFETPRQVRRVEIHGNEAFSDRKLRGFLRTRGSSWFKPWRHPPYRSDFVRFDRVTLQSYYRRHGFLAARVDSAPAIPVPGTSARVDVHFFLTEGSLTRLAGVRLEGTTPLSEAEVQRVLKLEPSDPLDITMIEADRQAIEDHYADLGYAAVQVRDSLEVDSVRALVVYRIVPGPIVRMGQVGVEGIKDTRRRVVTRELTVHPGDILSRKKLAESQQRIYDTGLYGDVIFERGDIDSMTHLADLHLTVRERKMAWVDVGLGYGTLDQLRLTSEWGHRNIGHEGIRFVASGRLGFRVTTPDSAQPKSRLGNRRADAAISQPWIFGTRTQATVGGYAEQIVQTQTGDRALLLFPLRAYGASLALRRDLWRWTRGTLAFEHRHVISDSTSLKPAPGEEEKSYSTRRVGLSIERDTRINPFDPKAGSDLIGNTVIAGGVLKGSARFTKLSGAATTYIPVPRRITLALRLQAGYIRPFGERAVPAGDTLSEIERNIPVDDRFVTGGASSVRGYFENEIGFRILSVESAGVVKGEIRGGELLLLGSVEARFPLFWVLGGAAFMDAGNVWERPRDVSLKRVFTVTGGGVGYSDMRYSVGAGIRIATPVGPVRFDYGWKLKRARSDERDLSSSRGTFHFSLGQAF